jgi:type IV secretory pathway VirB3-like protein
MNSSDIIINCLHPNTVYRFGTTESYYNINIPLIVINVCLMVLIVLGNATVILAYLRNKALQSVPIMLLISLALTDLFVGLIAQPLFIAILVRDVLGFQPLCWLELLSSLSLKFCAGTSLMTLSLIISVERYSAICHPIRHRLWITKRKVKRAVAVLWSFLLALAVSLLLGYSYKIYFLILTFLTFISIAVLSFACGAIMVKLKARRKRQASDDQSRIRTHIAANTTSNEQEKREYKIAVTMFYIVGAIVVCYLPMFAAIVYAQVIGSRDKLYLKYFYPVAMTLISLNSLLNPIIYCLRNKRFIIAIRKKKGQPENTSASASNTYTIAASCNRLDLQ